MLRYKHGMPAKRGLFAIVYRHCRGKPPANEVACMFQHNRKTLRLQICALARCKPEPPPKRRTSQRIEDIIQVFYRIHFFIARWMP
jgi:hypothetical protein